MKALLRLFIFISFFIFNGVILAKETKISCPTSRYILPELTDYDHSKYSPDLASRIYLGKSFIASIDAFDDDNFDGNNEYLAQPNWVSYELKSYQSVRESNYAPSFKRPAKWYRIKDFNIERKAYKTKKSLNDSYSGVGKKWNRGHLATRADSNRISPEYGCNTHVFANAVPQDAKFNKGIWLGLENYVSSLSNQLGQLWVVTGPIFNKGASIEYIGETEKNEIPVAIPDALFKIIFLEGERGVEVISFIYPNKYEELPIAYKKGICQTDKVYDHTQYIVSLAEIEKATNLLFFADLNIDLTAFKNQKATQLPVIEDQFRVGYCL